MDTGCLQGRVVADGDRWYPLYLDPNPQGRSPTHGIPAPGREAPMAVGLKGALGYVKKNKKVGKKEEKKKKRERGAEQSVVSVGLLGALRSYRRAQPPSACLICLFFIKQIR